MGVSKTIVNAPCVVFLGAGASKPLGLQLMQEFVRGVKDSAPHRELFDSICKQNEDLEYLFEQFAELETKDYLTLPQKVNFGLELPDHGLKNSAQMLKSWLQEQVFLHYRSIDENHKNLSLLSNILKPLLQRSRPVVVFTTNYDPAIEVLCRRVLKCTLVDGFRHDALRQQYVWDREVFDNASFPTTDSLVLFKLHGSTDWVKSEGRIVKSVPMFGGEDALHKNVLIFPATRKVAIEDPFFTCYDYLGKCLANAKLCLVIGYSFRDYDALTRFKAAKIENHALTISILDPNASGLARFLADNGIQSNPNPFAVGIQESEYLLLLAAEVAKSM